MKQGSILGERSVKTEIKSIFGAEGGEKFAKRPVFNHKLPTFHYFSVPKAQQISLEDLEKNFVARNGIKSGFRVFFKK